MMKRASSAISGAADAAEPDVAATGAPGPQAPPLGHGRASSDRLRLFVVHAPAPGDTSFVDGFLLEALRLPEDEVLVSTQLEPGAVIVREIARGAVSPVTVVVVSPAFLASPWAQFANELALHHSVTATSGDGATLVPAILEDCELPLLSQFREPLDFRNKDREHWESEAARLRKRLDAPAPTGARVPCPYPGMRPFTRENADRFHGRDKEVTDLLGRLRDGRREIYVIGPSGSGKSSVVAAGLIPGLDRWPERAGGSFLACEMQPGPDPVVALASALAATAAGQSDAATATEQTDAAMSWLGAAVGRLLSQPGHDRVLVFVDQLEELFTIANPAARAAFTAAVRLLRADARVALVLTLRADFYGSLMESDLWADLDGQVSRLEVSSMRGDKLRLAIEAPARALGVYFEPVLVERLLHDVADEPGALPLLQDTLVDLWHRRTRGLLRLAEYEAMSDGAQSGLAVTVARRADGALHDLSPRRREIARRVFLRLVQLGEGTPTRRQQPRTALATTEDTPEEIDAVVRHLADRRLITTSGDAEAAPSVRVDLAHEVLLTAWPVLGEWIRTRREDEQRRRVLEAKAAEWVQRGAGPSRLLDADELRETRGWLSDDKARDLGVSEDIRRLIAHSEATLAAQIAETQTRRRRLRRWVIVALATLTTLVVAVSTLAVIARRRSEDASAQTVVAQVQTREARRELARNYITQASPLLLAGRPAEAAPLLLAAREAGSDDVVLCTLFHWARQGLPLAQLVHHGVISDVAWSPDGRRLMTSSDDWTAQIWDTRSWQPVLPRIKHAESIRAIAWSPDGTRVATASADGTARVWDAVTGQPLTPALPHEDAIERVAWNTDGTLIATRRYDGIVRIWDAHSGQPVGPPLSFALSTAAVAWSPDLLRVAFADLAGGAQVADARSGERLTQLPSQKGWITAIAWSPDGTRIAMASHDKTARVWDPRSGQATTPPLEHADRVATVVWSPDGTRIATASDDKMARVWDARSGKPVTSPLGQTANVTSFAWSPDGRWIATAREDNTVEVWAVDSGQPVMPPLAHLAEIERMAWSPDGTRLATASKDGRARIWDTSHAATSSRWLAHQGIVSRAVSSPDEHDGTAETWDEVRGQTVTPAHVAVVWAAVWSPDGRRVATASEDGTARIWDAVSGQAVTPPLEHQGGVSVAVWSPDGRRVATASEDGTARIWDAVSGQAVTPPLAHHTALNVVAWSPDGRYVATASKRGTACIWDTSGHPVTPALVHDAEIRSAVWSPNGQRLATASDDRTARIWDTRGQPVTPPLVHNAEVAMVAWSSDGKHVATASRDGTARVWDAASGQAATPPLAHRGEVGMVAWSPDGTRVATASKDGSARVWDAATGQPITPVLAHTSWVWMVAWSPDGRRVATASEDGTARVWDAVTGRALTAPLAHQQGVGVVAWSPDGTRVATASKDASARVWDATSARPLTPLLKHGGAVLTVTWNPDGTRLATASADGTARLWDVSWDTGTLADWRAALEHADYALNDNGVVVDQTPKVVSLPTTTTNTTPADAGP